jgi:hypothetical protein
MAVQSKIPMDVIVLEWRPAVCRITLALSVLTACRCRAPITFGMPPQPPFWASFAGQRSGSSFIPSPLSPPPLPLPLPPYGVYSFASIPKAAPSIFPGTGIRKQSVTQLMRNFTSKTEPTTANWI